MFIYTIFGLEFDLKPLAEEIQGWWASGLKMLPNIILALLIVIIGYAVTSFLKKYFNRLSRKLVSDTKIANLLSSVMTIAIVLFFGLMVLTVLQLEGTVNKIVAAGGVVGLALGLAFQDPILNFFSGVMLTLQKLFKVGDLVEVDGYFGKVKEITLRHTSIETLTGQEVMIPNKIVLQTPLKNYNILNKRRIDLTCGVSYGDDLSKVKEITIQAIKNNVAFDEQKGIQLFFNEFGSSSINYTLRFWLAQNSTEQPAYLQAQSDAIMAIKSAYDDNDIMIPFPIRTLDFGIKGGEKLREMLATSLPENRFGKNGKSEHALNGAGSSN